MRRMTKEEKLAKEELTRTQVLNLSELERIASYEKGTSKKPAIFLAIMGIMCITIGASYNSVINIFNGATTTSDPSITQKKVETDAQIPTPVSTVSCQYNEYGNADGYNTVVDMTLIFNDGKLTSYTKVMNVTPALGQEDFAAAKIANLQAAYHQTFDYLTIPGYQITTTSKGAGFETIVSLDLKTLDPTQLNGYHELNVVTKAEFALDDTKEIVATKAATLGYICK